MASQPLRRGRPRPHAPGDVPAARDPAVGAGVRDRGHAARRPDRRPPRARRRDARRAAAHVLGAALGVRAARQARRLGARDVLAGRPPGAGGRPRGGRARRSRPTRRASRRAIDGCGILTYAFPLREVARAFAILADPEGLPTGDPRTSLAPLLRRDPRRDARVSRARRRDARAARHLADEGRTRPVRQQGRAGGATRRSGSCPAPVAAHERRRRRASPSRSRTATATIAAPGRRRSRRCARPACIEGQALRVLARYHRPAILDPHGRVGRRGGRRTSSSRRWASSSADVAGTHRPWTSRATRTGPSASSRARRSTRSGPPTGGWRSSTTPTRRGSGRCPGSSRSRRRTSGSSTARAGCDPRAAARGARAAGDGAWRRDATRARASREAWPAPGPRDGTSRPGAARTGRRERHGTARPADRGQQWRRRRRGSATPPQASRKATPGSTTYDEAKPRPRSSPSGTAGRGTASRWARTGRSTLASTPTLASTVPSTSPGPGRAVGLDAPDGGADADHAPRPSDAADATEPSWALGVAPGATDDRGRRRAGGRTGWAYEDGRRDLGARARRAAASPVVARRRHRRRCRAPARPRGRRPQSLGRATCSRSPQARLALAAGHRADRLAGGRLSRSGR